MPTIIAFNPTPFFTSEENFKLIISHLKKNECTFGPKENPYFVLPKVVSTKSILFHTVASKVAIALGYNLPWQYNYHWSNKPDEDERGKMLFLEELRDPSHSIIITLVHYTEPGILEIFQKVSETLETHVLESKWLKPKGGEAFTFEYHKIQI